MRGIGCFLKFAVCLIVFDIHSGNASADIADKFIGKTSLKSPSSSTERNSSPSFPMRVTLSPACTPRNFRHIHHELIHADTAENRRFFSADQHPAPCWRGSWDSRPHSPQEWLRPPYLFLSQRSRRSYRPCWQCFYKGDMTFQLHGGKKPYRRSLHLF